MLSALTDMSASAQLVFAFVLLRGRPHVSRQKMEVHLMIRRWAFCNAHH